MGLSFWYCLSSNLQARFIIPIKFRSIIKAKAMSTVTIRPLLPSYRRANLNFRDRTNILLKPNYINYSIKSAPNARRFCSFKKLQKITASSSTSTSPATSTDTTPVRPGDVFFKETFPLKRTHAVCYIRISYRLVNISLF